MTFNNKNQNDILDIFDIDYLYENQPINRAKTKPQVEDKYKNLTDLKIKISNIENCNLKSNANKLVFSDGNPLSQLMIVGEGPGQKEDEIGKPFVGEAGMLLNKMLKAINVKREDVYITNVVNYRPPNNRKPETSEIIRYSEFLREHIKIINPKLLILMGSTAMESLFGSKIKITKERGTWKEVIIDRKTFETMITFHPAYLLRQPEQKKNSWEDLKMIKKRIDELEILI